MVWSIPLIPATPQQNHGLERRDEENEKIDFLPWQHLTTTSSSSDDLRLPQRYSSHNPTTYNFQLSNTPMLTNVTDLSWLTTKVAGSPSTAKRRRVPEAVITNTGPTDAEIDDEMEEGGAHAKPPGACTRCKTLKVKCEFRNETKPCKRCIKGGHECTISGRSTKRVHLLNQIREQAAEIQKLMAQVEQKNARQHAKRPRTYSSSSAAANAGSRHSSPLASSTGADIETENSRAVEDWIARARDSGGV
ncbi:Zn(2)-C6 fungal-type domain-containing protein [Mycena sanguinolenta]|uniref:Zn(2)-C6 fungal-type domain-containing protein n=1 Tax=Mycena sanguinolenta TaxID=230812 RepID=A0A8H6Z6G0_9AGAR|nr:Zn(2)-C6 fungal-type domain-containing protein [Mycena sanguinolenta]